LLSSDLKPINDNKEQALVAEVRHTVPHHIDRIADKYAIIWPHLFTGSKPIALMDWSVGR
jgi:hypothetical protein